MPGSLSASSPVAQVPKSLATCARNNVFALHAAPMLAPTCGLAAGIWLADNLASALLAWGVAPAAAVLAACMAVWSRRRGRVVLATLASGAAAAGLGYVRYSVAECRSADNVARAVGQKPVLARVVGLVATQPVEAPPVLRNPFLPHEPSPHTTFVLSLERVGAGSAARAASGRILVRVGATGLGLHLGEMVELTGWLHRFQSPKNPGETDWPVLRRRQGIDVGLSTPSAALVRRLPGGGPGALRLVHAIRAGGQSLLMEPLATRDATACMQLLDVLVLGQRSAADARLNEAFQKAGGIHFLSIGGFHIGILAGFAWGIARLVAPRSRRVAAGVMLGVTLLYLVVAEPTAPSLRGVIGVALLALAAFFDRPFTPLNWLVTAGFLILVWNPHDLFQAGFQMSFVLVLALVLWMTPLTNLLRFHQTDPTGWWPWVAWRFRRGFVALCVATGLCFVAALPLAMFHFRQMTPWGLLGALVLTPVISLTIILSFITMAVGVLPGPAGGWLGAALMALVESLLAIVEFLGRLPGAVVHTPQPPAWLVALTLIGAVLIEGLRRIMVSVAARLEGDDAVRAAHRRGRRLVVVPSVVLLTIWLGWGLAEAWPPRQGYVVRFLAVGDGSAMTIVGPDGRAAVFDAGSAENLDVGAVVARSLRCDRVRRVDWALVSHANFDHYSGLPGLGTGLPITRITSGPYFERAACRASDRGRLARALGRPIDALQAGDRIELAGGELEVLWPPADLPVGTSANDTSLVARWAAGGVSVLFTGDIEALAIRSLLERHATGALDLHADVLVAPHHGEVIPQLTEALIAAVRPKEVVVSSQEQRERFDAMMNRQPVPGARIAQTARDGCVTLRIDGRGGYAVERGAGR